MIILDTIPEKPLKNPLSNPRAYSNPVRRCVECIYRVGFGYTTISNITGVNKALCRKWIHKSGLERGYVIKSKGYKRDNLEMKSKAKKLQKQNELVANRRFEVNLNRCLRRSSRFFLTHERRRRNQRLRRLNNPSVRIVSSLRLRTWKVIKGQGGEKLESLTRDMLGCNKDQLMAHLSSQFNRRMSWDNYGKHWEVDHIMPCSSFDLTKTDEQRKCFHFSNLRPLTIHSNRSKHARIVEHQPELLLRLVA